MRWWDYWLKGRDTGVLQDPKLVIYMQHWHPPDPNLEAVPGEWRREEGRPHDVKPTTLFLQPNHTLADSVAAKDVHQLKYVPSIGVESGFWWGELLADPRPVDAFSLVYDSAPLQDEVAILGRPHALLRASATRLWLIGLPDSPMWPPTEQLRKITGAGLNGAQRESMSEPRDLEPGKVYPLDIEMHLTSWVFPKGHRIRVAISNALWPMVLPTPYPMTTSLELGANDGSRLVLPVVPVHRHFSSAISTAATLRGTHRHSKHRRTFPGDWTTTRDEVNHKTTVHWHGKTETTYPWGKETDYENLTYDADDVHPEISAVQGEAKSVFELKGRVLTWQGHLSVTTDQKNFYYKYTRELLKDGQMVKTKTWQETIPRDHQ